MTLKEAQEKVDQWINRYGVRYFNELTNVEKSRRATMWGDARGGI